MVNSQCERASGAGAGKSLFIAVYPSFRICSFDRFTHYLLCALPGLFNPSFVSTYQYRSIFFFFDSCRLSQAMPGRESDVGTRTFCTAFFSSTGCAHLEFQLQQFKTTLLVSILNAMFVYASGRNLRCPCIGRLQDTFTINTHACKGVIPDSRPKKCKLRLLVHQYDSSSLRMMIVETHTGPLHV